MTVTITLNKMFSSLMIHSVVICDAFEINRLFAI